MADWFDLGSTAVGGVGGIFSTLINNEHQKRMAREQMQWQQQENERAYQRDIDFWNMQNQYNSPQAQRERLEAAGANPMLAFGNGVNVTSGNSTSEVSMKPAQAIMPDLQPYNLGLPFHNIADKLMQLKTFHLQQDMQDAQIADIQASTLNKLQDLKLKEGTFDYSVEQARETLLQTIQNTKRIEQQTDIEKEAWELKRISNRLGIDLQRLDIDTKKLENEARSFDLDLQKEIRLYKVVGAALETLERQADIKLKEETTNKIMQETKNLTQTHDITSYWDNLQRILKTPNLNGGGPLGSIANQFAAHGLQLLDNISSILGIDHRFIK